LRNDEFRDVTWELVARLVRLVDSGMELRGCVTEITSSLQAWSGCEAVGVRLRDGDDYPYYETRGFPPEHVLAENRLCSFGPDGKVQRDAALDPVLDCMCGNILRGRFDPSKPFFTAHGSFWSNCTSDLLARTTDAERLARTRNRCNGEGYESVALVPMHTGSGILGLLQFNDRRRDRFDPVLIGHFETLADTLGIALTRRQTEEALRASEALYRSLFENLLNGFAYCRMLFEAGKPVDFVYLAVNDSFLSQTGLRDVVGRKVSEVVPGIRESDPGLFEVYGRVAETGKPEQLEMYLESLRMWLAISVYCPAPDHFVAVFDVVTERKRAEEELRRSLAEKEVLLREVQHRVKNNLNLISSLLNLQATSIQTPEQALSGFANSRDRIMAMAMVHEELYSSGNYSHIDMGAYLARLADTLRKVHCSGAGMSISVRSEGVVLTVDTAIPCALILNELMTNSCKHAFPEGRRGKIEVVFRVVDEGWYELSVSDDGVGLPDGVGDEGDGFMGLPLVRILCQQLGGAVEVSTGKGTAFRLRFPADHGPGGR
jgi:two-component sensor histidine kinase/PAS domain-containing protein